MKNSKLFFICCILFLMSWVIYLFKPFWLTMMTGFLLSIATSVLYGKILKFTNNKELLSSFIITLGLCLLFLIPLIYAVTKAAIYIATIDFGTGPYAKTISFIQNFELNLPSKLSFIEVRAKETLASIDLTSLSKSVVSYISKFGKSGANFVVDMLLIVVFYFFANYYGQKMSNIIKEQAPMDSKQIDYILSEVTNTMSVVFYSTISSAVLQGFLFGVIATIFGYDGVLMGILYAFASLIPVVGGAVVFVPVVLFELANGNIASAIIILAYTIIIISIVADNFLKPLIIKFISSKIVTSASNINEIVIFFAMLAGMTTFGFWGIILGPAIVTLFVALLKSYKIFNL
ncbi:AI-2E family transporter [uncultured Campylobacter sp.]|uniref:AI-2E family transporter n=1 Tax=uncultured Campylobacter sp. TaxID=218934 RepID=UPI00262EA229|nr:AI-2E family transporter [uncultured Campylobacter sp.]